MKKGKKTALVAAAFIASMNLNGCAYGPEPYYEDPETPTAAEVTSESKVQETTEAEKPEEYRPEDDIQVCVYGPPEYFE